MLSPKTPRDDCSDNAKRGFETGRSAHYEGLESGAAAIVLAGRFLGSGYARGGMKHMHCKRLTTEELLV
jgi:hypothetical protein